MGDLRKNFSKKEFFCKHCGAYKKMDDDLLDGLQTLSDNINRTITINSGYRCKNHPIERVKSTPGEHEKGCAADISIDGLSPKQILTEVLKIPQFVGGGIGVYPGKNLIHVDTRGSKARWSYINGVQRTFEAGLKLLK